MRFGAVGWFVAAALVSGEEPAFTAEDPFEAAAALMSDDRKERRRGAEELTARGGVDMVAPLVDAVFFTPRERRRELFETLSALTGEERDSYRDWIETLGAHEEWVPHAGYPDWKRSLLARIDENYRAILYPGAPAQIRLEEVVSGGVPVDGIPPLDYPPTVPAERVRYLKRDEKVFGVSLNGEARAYPLRFLDWHEMLNDTVGGQPFALSYCTLCGSGILYATDTPSGGRYTFGTSGLLYRSNKLMFDRQTLSLWSNLTGEPVVGRLANSPIQLEVLPMTLTTWGAWVEDHPETDVIDLEGVEELVRGRYRFDYRPGVADRARAGVSFPVWLADERMDRDEEVYTLRVNGRPKAYVLDRLLEERVVNDELGGEAIVLIAESESGAVRAFARGERSFSPAPSGEIVVDDAGNQWRVTEGALVAVPGAGGATEPMAGSPEEMSLDRVPGHVAYWFGWFGFYPQTEVYGLDEREGK